MSAASGRTRFGTIVWALLRIGRNCDREDGGIPVSAVNTGRGALALRSVNEAFYRPSVACSGARKGNGPMSLHSDMQGLYIWATPADPIDTQCNRCCYESQR
jgi:hypothetical protein